MLLILRDTILGILAGGLVAILLDGNFDCFLCFAISFGAAGFVYRLGLILGWR